MNTLPRSCTAALARAAKSSQTCNVSRRAFSQSAACHRGSLPTFKEPSDPEIGLALAKLNAKILLPQHLTHEQELLVYKEKNRARIEAEPLYITLGDVELPLEHIDRTTDIPSKFSIIRQVVDKAQTNEDWENVVRMLEGFHEAGIKLKPEWEEKIVRKLFYAGKGDLVVQALERVRDTGLTLKKEWVRNLVLQGLREKAAASNWQEKKTLAALNSIEHVLELMEHKMHLGKSSAASGDPRASPFVIAYPLELAAMRAKLHLNGEDKGGKVATYALRMMTAFKQDDFMKTSLPAALSEKFAIPETFSSKREQQDALAHLRRNIELFIPMWHGLQTASTVLGVKMPMAGEAKNIIGMVGKAIQSGKKTLQKNNALWNVKDKLEQCKV